MRKITGGQIALFSALLILIVFLAVATTYGLLGWLPLGDFRGVVLTGAGLVIVYLYAFAVYRVFLSVSPLQEGILAEGSRAEFSAQVHFLFYLLLFNTLVRTNFIPIPLMRMVYIALGAKMGSNTFSAGAILDPPLVSLGANTIVGHNAVLFSHAIEGHHFALGRIDVGDHVTIGAMAVVMPGVSIGDGAIVSAGSVVLKGTKIGPGEMWGGVPAKRLR